MTEWNARVVIRKGIGYGRESHLTVEIKHVLECSAHHGDAALYEKGVTVRADKLDPAIIVLQIVSVLLCRQDVDLRSCHCSPWSSEAKMR